MSKDIVLKINNLTKRFGNVVAVDNLTIEYINRGEFVTFLGPSGCGKTTLLRMIGGFYYPTSGEIIMNGEVINNVPPEQRRTSMVFQNYALFPHMTVYDNISYGLKLRKLQHNIIKERVNSILKVVQLEGMENRKPSELSGGQQQRVALARCIVIEPEIILLDEPLSNLDANLRIMMREEIRRIQKALNLTTIFVTHDQEEAMSMSDRIIVMKDGKIQQIGTPMEIYEKPANLFVASFIGYINLIEGNVISNRSGFYEIKSLLGVFTNNDDSLRGITNGSAVTMVIRPESIDLLKGKNNKSKNVFPGSIKNYTYIGSLVRYKVSIDGFDKDIIVDISNPSGRGIYKIGDRVNVVFPDRFHCIKM